MYVGKQQQCYFSKFTDHNSHNTILKYLCNTKMKYDISLQCRCLSCYALPTKSRRVGNTYEWLDEDPLSRLALILLRCNTCPEISAKFSIIACNLQNVNFNKEFIFY